MSAPVGRNPEATSAAAADEQRMRDLVHFTMRTMSTERPVPFGALIVETKSGTLVQRAVNAVAIENDPSSHAELRAVRLACRRLKSRSLAGYTLYTTCEPCPMCMANCLWARLDRVVYGATIADANAHCDQIHIPAKEVARRSDIACVVNGPVMRELCCTLFTRPKMLSAFKTWTSRAPGGAEIKAGPSTSDAEAQNAKPSRTTPRRGQHAAPAAAQAKVKQPRKAAVTR